MPRSHRFSPPTKTDRRRANITLLTTVWLAFTATGVTAIVHATATINDRSVAQTAADAVALVAADRGVDTARDFAQRADIDVVTIAMSGNTATATVRAGSARASGSALKPG